MTARRVSLLRVAEWASWSVGLVGLAWCGTFQAGASTATKHDLERFDALRRGIVAAPAPDLSLWSVERVAAWHKSLRNPAPPPVAVLRIPGLRLEVPVLPGTDDAILDRAVGHIEGTAAPDAVGNIGLAAHRDGFFRGLKDIAPGDPIELVTMENRFAYRVSKIWIVDPADVWVLDPTPGRTLTLVTCYPFFFVGSAPQRFIVRAVPDGSTASQVSADGAKKWRE